MRKLSSSYRRHSFILRCWQERTDDSEQSWAWRFTLREVAERPDEQAFSSLGALLDFLLTGLMEGPDRPE